MTVVAADLDEDGDGIFSGLRFHPIYCHEHMMTGLFARKVSFAAWHSATTAWSKPEGRGVGDYDLDGHLDLFKTHFADEPTALSQRPAVGVSMKLPGRLFSRSKPVRCWGAGIVDLDHDAILIFSW